MGKYSVEHIKGTCVKEDVERLLLNKATVGCKLISVFPDNAGGTMFVFYEEDVGA